jgi:xanthine dehydrogenase YagS FAD-binding subunit
MTSFEWVDALSVDQATALLSASGSSGPIVAKAGGVDLVDLMKERVIRPSRIVNLRTIPGLDSIAFRHEGGMSIGALTTLARIEASRDIQTRYPALAEAARHAATPQVRNAGTIGGNLLQRPRCWYFRHEAFHAKDADPGPMIARGENQYHGIFDNTRTALVHASTPATALVAYGAQVRLAGAAGAQRTVPVQELLLPPDFARDRDAAIQPGELLTEVVVPASASGTRAAYHKQTERESYDWPICDVAVVLGMNGARVVSASVVLGWVAPTPRHAEESEHLLVGQTVNDALARKAARAAVASATPLTQNAYKVPVLETVIRRTILAAAAP